MKRKAVVSLAITTVLLLALIVQLEAAWNEDVSVGSVNTNDVSSLSGSATESGESDVDWWPMFHHDPRHTGYSTSKAPETNNTLWTYTTGNMISTSSPAVVDNRVYVGSYDNKVYCLNASTGTYIWSFTTSAEVRSSPAVADGKVYIGSVNPGKIYCLNASTGTEIWSYTTGATISSPAVVAGKVYIGSTVPGKLYCLNASTGAFIWSYTTGADIFTSSPAVVDEGVYIGSQTGYIYCLNASSGAFIWSYNTGSGVWSPPTVVDGKVYLSSRYSYKVFCLNASTGIEIWTYTTGGEMYWSCPAVADGRLYIGSMNRKVYCLNASTGTEIWTYTTVESVASSPAVADGKVYIGTTKFYCLNALTGAYIWSYTLGDWMDSGPAVADGKVYVSSRDRKVYAFGSPEVSVYPKMLVGPPPKIGETFNVNITIKDAIDLYTWQAGMTFNASVLECVSIAEGEFLQRAGVTTLWTPGTINNTAGTIGYSACSITGSTLGVNGTGQLMSITFEVISSGNSTLHITDVLLLDSDLVSITPVTIVDGEVVIHVQDISILSLTKSAAEAYPTWIVPFNVTVVVENQGTRTETFNVTAYANAIEIGREEVTLAAGANTTLEFNWNLAGVAEGTYTIRAEATVLYGEIDTEDNTKTDGTVKIKHPGDANDDSVLNAYDLGILAKAWGTSVGEPLYDARADFNGDGTIDELDHDILKAYWP